MTEKPTYIYRSLREDAAGSEIRILDLPPGSRDDFVCRLTHQSLPRSFGKARHRLVPDYEALSWTWGSSDDFATIEIEDKDGEPAELSVRSNLLQALHRLQQFGHPRKLWIDAICINQHDAHERDSQVAMMDQIFSNASNVCIWLGEHQDDSDVALARMREKSFGISIRATADEELDTYWKALIALMNRTWFGRRWVVQEVSLAKQATVQCGDSWVAWPVFEMAVVLFQRDIARITEFYRDSESADLDPDLFADVHAMGACRLVKAKSSLFRRNANRRITEYRYLLSDLVTQFVSFEAKEPHDTFYSIISLARETWARKKMHVAQSDGTRFDDSGDMRQHERRLNEEHSSRGVHLSVTAIENFKKPLRQRSTRIFEIDYQQPFFEVCQQFLAFTISTAGAYNLDIICRPWAPKFQNDEPRLPSWIQTVEDAPFSRQATNQVPGGFLTFRTNCDPLVGMTTHSPYNACRGVTAQAAHDWRFGDGGNLTARSLFVRGFELDAIGRVTCHSSNGQIPNDWYELVGLHVDYLRGEQRHSLVEQLLRTLVADRGVDGINPPEYWSLVMDFVGGHRSSPDGINFALKRKGSNPVVAEFADRIRTVIWNRRLFKSARDGHLGLVPKKAEVGDRICILRGCSVPVVLRRHADYYELMGECYLHSMMDGQAIDVQEVFDLKTVTFELR